MEFLKIKAPTFKVGKSKLNEYELRYLMLEVSQGKRPELIGKKVVDNFGEIACIMHDGSLSCSLESMAIMTRTTMEHIKAKKQLS